MHFRDREYLTKDSSTLTGLMPYLPILWR